MTSTELTLTHSNLEISLMDISEDIFSSNEEDLWLLDSGLQTQITTKLRELITYTQKIGNIVFAVGKIILIKIIEFIKDHPHLVTGIGISLTVGLGIQILVSSIPFIGTLLAPVGGALTSALGIVILGIAGHRLDKRSQGRYISESFIGVAEDIIEITKEFFAFIADILNAVFHQVITA